MRSREMLGSFVREMLNKNIREDNRGFLDYRPMTIKVGTIPNAEGSAEVNLGNTKILAGVKLDLGEPMPDKPEEGNLITSAELLPLAEASYDAGPPTPESIEFARVVDRGIRAAEVVDMDVLYVEPEKVWNVFVDLYVLNYDGNLFDAGTLAATSALLSTRMPKYEEGKVIREGNLGKLKTKNTVTSCTFAKVDNRIILDPTAAEEIFMNSRITIANDANVIRAMQKGLGGAFSIGEIEKLVEMSFDRSKQLRQIIEKSLSD